MKRKTQTGIVVLCLAIALLTAGAAAAGLFLRGDGAFEPVTSVRGEQYEMATMGVYAYNAERVVAEGIGWDVFTLLFAIPALLAALPSLARGSLRGKLFALGILAYLFYQYLMYAVAWAFGPLFLLFVAIYALSLTAIVWIISTLQLNRLAERFSASFPKRGMAVLCFLMAAVLLFMWLARILSALSGQLEGVLDGQTTLVVQALDLGLIVPLALFTGVAAWRGGAAGYLLSAVVAVKAFAIAAAICAMLLSAWAYEGTLEVVPLAIFAAAAGVSAWLGARIYRSMLPAPSGDSQVAVASSQVP
ncbi:MAG: hypothetical protein PVH59_00725 [Anaerolineae bacterium]|jgi:hypothetical protein